MNGPNIIYQPGRKQPILSKPWRENTSITTWREDSTNKKVYENYLKHLLLSSYNPVCVHAVYQLCKIWYAEADKYNPSLISHIGYYGERFAPFDSSYRLYFALTVLELLNRFENRLDSFSYIKTDLLNMRSVILASTLTVMTQDVQLPDSNIPVLLQYRNISHIYTRIIRIRPSDILYPNKFKNISSFLKMPVLRRKDPVSDSTR